MSQLRQRTKKVRAIGAAQRRNWDPDPASFHYRLYTWWQQQTGYQTTRENFCHYWRVALLWAPARKLGNKLPSWSGRCSTWVSLWSPPPSPPVPSTASGSSDTPPVVSGTSSAALLCLGLGW